MRLWWQQILINQWQQPGDALPDLSQELLIRCYHFSLLTAYRQDYTVACLNYTLQTMMPLPGWPAMAPKCIRQQQQLHICCKPPAFSTSESVSVSKFCAVEHQIHDQVESLDEHRITNMCWTYSTLPRNGSMSLLPADQKPCPHCGDSASSVVTT